jgi:hypothetical protein
VRRRCESEPPPFSLVDELDWEVLLVEFARRVLRRGRWRVRGVRFGRVVNRVATELKERRVDCPCPCPLRRTRLFRVRRVCDGEVRVRVARSVDCWRSSAGCASQRENRDGRRAICD